MAGLLSYCLSSSDSSARPRTGTLIGTTVIFRAVGRLVFGFLFGFVFGFFGRFLNLDGDVTGVGILTIGRLHGDGTRAIGNGSHFARVDGGRIGDF